MSVDEEDRFFYPIEERIKTLGFRPQKEIQINHLLPYANELDEESGRLFRLIKENLAKAVMLREVKPACGVWAARLMKYVRIYGLQFSKEDHIALVKLVYEMLLIPDLEPSRIHKFATLFLMLTKKVYLISPEELTLPWRPLYDLGKKLFDKSRTHIGMYHYQMGNNNRDNGNGEKQTDMISMIKKFISGSGLDEALELFGLTGSDGTKLPTSVETSFVAIIKTAKVYFEVSATQEILDELLPLISPWSSDSNMLSQLALFLPVSLNPKHAERGHKLWIDEILTLWDTAYNSLAGISNLMVLFSSLAKRNPGAVDWSPHVPEMFSRFLHNINLPVSYKDMQYSKNHNIDANNVATWIVWTIGPDGLILKHLRTFLVGIESYLHSANSGRWSFKIRALLKKLSKEFMSRVRSERELKYKSSWQNQVPPEMQLRDEDITEFVKIVMEPTILAVHSRNGAADISYALQTLATLRPALVIPPLIEKLRTSLESLTEPHRVTAAMSAVAAVARPMLRGPAADYPEGPTHLVPLLLAAIPGLDPNDIRKTIVTLHFILVFSWMVPYVDCSSASQHWSDLTEEELLTCQSTAQFEDFVLLYLDRLFAIIDSSTLENARLETKESDSLRSKTESVIELALSSTSTAVFMQCSPKIFKEALRKFKQFATSNTFETNVAGSIVGNMLSVFARVDPVSTLAAFVPQLCDDLNEILSTEEALHEENPPRDLLYRLLLLSSAVQCDGNALLVHIPQIRTVLDRALKLHAKDAYVRACDVLAHMMSNLTIVDLTEFKSSSKDFAAAPKEWLPIREWGRGCVYREANFEWHMPSKEEITCAQSLFDTYAKHEIAKLNSWLNGDIELTRRRRLRTFYILNASICCNPVLPPPDEPIVEFNVTRIPPIRFRLTSGVLGELLLDGENVRQALTRLLVRVQAKMLEDVSADDTKGFEMLLQVWERVSGVRSSRAGPSLEVHMRSNAALERVLSGRGGPPGGGRLRPCLADALRLQDEARMDLQSDAGIGATGLTILQALFQLSVNSYTSIRIHAQIRLYSMMAHYPFAYRGILPQLVELLTKGGEGEEYHSSHKGALYIMLGPRSAPLIAKQEWGVVKTLWPAILRAPTSEKPSILRLEKHFSETLQRQYPAVNTRLTVTDACIEAAKYFVSESMMNDKEFAQQLDEAEEVERAKSDQNEKDYYELIEELVMIAEAPNVQWRRLEFALQMLIFCPSLQTNFPPNACRLIVNSLIHDDFVVRRLAIRLTHFALKQRKQKVKKITVDPYEVAGVPRPEKTVPGYRKDNEWATWSESRVPTTDEEWDKPWLRTSNCGFYAWPKTIEVAAPASEQHILDRSRDEMDEGERHIFDFFTNEQNVEKLISFITVEEKKGKDKFSGSRFAMFRVLFRCYGEVVADRFMDQALKLASDTQEASQRYAAEIAAAAIRAPRYWPRERATNFYQKGIDIIRAGLYRVTPETMEDWGTCVASALENLDPCRAAPVLRGLVQIAAPQPSGGEDADADQESSYGVCARLYALQGAIGAMSWRAAALATEILHKLDAARFIQHPYQNVRESVGSIMMTILDLELVFPGGDTGPAPRLAEFIAAIKPKLSVLYDAHGEIVIKTATPMSGGPWTDHVPAVAAPPEPEMSRPDTLVPVSVARLPASDHNPAPPQDETDNADNGENDDGTVSLRAEKALVTRMEAALRIGGDGASHGPKEHARALHLLTTVLRACMGVIVRGVNGATITQYGLMRSACALSARGPPQPHDELARAADGFLASLAMVHHSEEAFDVALDSLEDVMTSRSWWARLACVHFAQPLLFYGLPMLCQQPARAVRAERLATSLMMDPRVEVRQAAAKLLTGLMHCRALPDEDVTLKRLRKNCRSKDIVERHCGVLGLCAYLSSRPYSLGPKTGVVLEELSRHVNAPDPVPSAIRTALADFRRTHQDDWPKHREALTEEELDLLSDLTCPPSYCA